MKNENNFLNLISIRKKSSRNCPDCYTLMTPYSCKGIVIDKCDLCNGIWFDDKEFGVFKKNLDTFDLTKIEKIYHEPKPDSYQISCCPDCKTSLHDVKYAYNTDVRLKKCNKCKGLWLPIYDTLNLVKMAKISQEISEDTQALAKEMSNYNKNLMHYKEIAKTGKVLGQKHDYFDVQFWKHFILVLPLYAENKRKQFPTITVGLIIINVVIYYLMQQRGLNTLDIYSSYAMQPKEISNFESIHTIITSMFMHAGFLHLLGNMFFLWMFGDNVEDNFGKFKFIFFYIFCGILASLAHIINSPDSMIPTLGASGAISGVMGAYLYLFPAVNIKTLVIGQVVDFPAWLYLVSWFGLQLMFALIYLNKGGGVAWLAHIGGFVAGLLITYLYKKNLSPTNLRN